MGETPCEICERLGVGWCLLHGSNCDTCNGQGFGVMGASSNPTEERRAHEACPGDWCLTIACAQCGEMLTNPKPAKDGRLAGICHSHGRGALGVLMRREDCLVAPEPTP